MLTLLTQHYTRALRSRVRREAYSDMYVPACIRIYGVGRRAILPRPTMEEETRTCAIFISFFSSSGTHAARIATYDVTITRPRYYAATRRGFEKDFFTRANLADNRLLLLHVPPTRGRRDREKRKLIAIEPRRPAVGVYRSRAVSDFFART